MRITTSSARPHAQQLWHAAMIDDVHQHARAGRMSDEPDNINLAHLRAIRVDLQLVGRHVSAIETRVGRLEIGLAPTQVAIADRSVRMDGIDDRLMRIERRLDLAEAPTGPGL